MSGENLESQAIMQRISSFRQDLLLFTGDMMSIPTENPPGRSYRQCVELISRKLEKMGFFHSLVEVPGNPDYPRYYLLAEYGKGKPVIYFHGHYDVVPAFTPEQLRPCFQNGRLYGRGAVDMKGGLAAMIFALHALQAEGFQPKGRIVLVIVPDEETGGNLGAKFLADSGLIQKDALGMLMPEPTSGKIWNACRGAISLRISIKGKAAHVGLQHEGRNAFEEMVKVAQPFLELKNSVEKRVTAHQIQPEEAKRSILLLGGTFGGGTNFNVVPERAYFTLDRRINPEEDLQEGKKEIFRILERLQAEGLQLENEILQEGESAHSPDDGILANALKESVEEVEGISPVFQMCPGLLEIRFYAKLGIPAYAYGPGDISLAHGPEEYIEEGGLLSTAKVYALTAYKLLKDENLMHELGA